MNPRNIFPIVTASLLFGTVLHLSSQVLVPANVTGTGRFTNPDSPTRARFGPMTSARVGAGRPVPDFRDLISSYSDYFLPGTGFSFTYNNTVAASAPPGILYSVTAQVALYPSGTVGTLQEYWFGPRLSEPVVAGMPVAAVNLEECAGVLDLSFVDELGAPLTLTGGGVEVNYEFSPGQFVRQADAGFPTGTLQQNLAVRSDVPLQVVVHFQTGTGDSRVVFENRFTVTVGCDAVAPLVCRRPALASLGQITGNVNMAGVPDVPEQPAYYNSGVPVATTLQAINGPFGNSRDANLWTSPYNGAFALPNLWPTDVSTYEVFGHLYLRSGTRSEYFQTPHLGGGTPQNLNANSGVNVTAGLPTSLGNTFVMNPVYVKGRVLFKGPPEAAGSPSPFRLPTLFRGPLQLDTSGSDGIPDSFYDVVNYDSRLVAYGLNTLAEGASYTAARGLAFASFAGDYVLGSGAFEGDYEMVLGGLNGEASVWTPMQAKLLFQSPAGTPPDGYVAGNVSLADQLAPVFTVVPGQTNNHDFAVCFGKVTVNLRTTAGVLWSPYVKAYGAFYANDFQGHFRWYQVDAGFGGTPLSDTTTNVGEVVLYLPQGSYVLQSHAQVQTPGNPVASVGWAPISITVGGGDSGVVEPCLGVSVTNVPQCGIGQSVRITGWVSSCTNVTKIAWDRGDNVEHVICNDCGVNPSFAFDLPVNGPCGDYPFTVTAYDANGGKTVSQTKVPRAIPPTLTCVGDKSVYLGVLWTFDPPTPTISCCGTNVSVSVQSTETNFGSCKIAYKRTWIATDCCGNTNTCSQTVTVLSIPPHNDLCINALPVSVGSPAACGTTVCATPSAVGSIPLPCGVSFNSPDVWYTFTAPCAGPVTVDTCGVCTNQSTTLDAVLSVYMGSCEAFFTQIACNDDAGGACGLASRVAFDAVGGVTYYIRVSGYAGASGSFRLNISQAVVASANDVCGKATPIGDGTYPFSNCAANTDGPQSTNCQPRADVWFRYTNQCGGLIAVDTCNSGFNTVLAIYSGACTNLSRITCNDNATAAPCANSQASFVTFTALAGVPYLIQVGGVLGATGSGWLTVTGPTNCPPQQPCIEIHCPLDIVKTTCGTNPMPVDFVVFATNDCNASDLALSFTRSPGSLFPVGNTLVCATASGSGESNSCCFNVTVLPNFNCTNPPPCVDIQCPNNQVVYACHTNCVSVPFTVTATDLCTGNSLPVVTDYPSGYCFWLGTNWVKASASSGGQTNSCSFQVMVFANPACTNGCSTNLLVNGSFEQPGLPDGYALLPGGDPTIAGWTTVLNGVQYYNPVPAWLFVNTGFAAAGNYLLDLAPAQVGGGIQQTFATIPNRPYHVSFAMGTSKERGRNGTASLTATVAGEAHAFNMNTASPSIAWERKEFTFVTPDTSATLVFATTDDPGNSFVNLDDVRVSDCCTNAGLNIKHSVTVTWSCGFLQGATVVSGPYMDVPGATSPYTVPDASPYRYFRVREN